MEHRTYLGLCQYMFITPEKLVNINYGCGVIMRDVNTTSVDFSGVRVLITEGQGTYVKATDFSALWHI